jgi:hypothetical protein
MTGRLQRPAARCPLALTGPGTRPRYLQASTQCAPRSRWLFVRQEGSGEARLIVPIQCGGKTRPSTAARPNCCAQRDPRGRGDSAGPHRAPGSASHGIIYAGTCFLSTICRPSAPVQQRESTTRRRGVEKCLYSKHFSGGVSVKCGKRSLTPTGGCRGVRHAPGTETERSVGPAVWPRGRCLGASLGSALSAKNRGRVNQPVRASVRLTWENRRASACRLIPKPKP